MQYRTLRMDLTVSAIGLGCMEFSYAYGAPTEKKQVIYLIQQALDSMKLSDVFGGSKICGKK